MPKVRLFVLATAVALLLSFTSLTLTPTTQAQGQNLLTNPGFDGTYTAHIPMNDGQRQSCPMGVCDSAQMPPGWLPWWRTQSAEDEAWINRMPEYKPVCPYDLEEAPCPFENRLKGTRQALQYFSFHSNHQAGIYQTVSVPRNARLKFSIWGQAWSTWGDGLTSEDGTPVNMRIGIDPTGGTNPYSPDIVWSGFANPYDAYQYFEVEATAQGDKVTVFTWSNPERERKHNDIYWDEASLTVAGAGGVTSSGGTGATGASAPAAPVFNAPTPTPNAAGEIIVVVQPGDSLWSIAARASISLDQLLELNGLQRSDFISVGDQLLIGRGEAVAPAPETPAEADAEVGATGGVTGTETITATAAITATETATETEDAAVVSADTAVAEPTPAPSGGTICLIAFQDDNQDGQRADNEPLRPAVAFTLASGETVVSNYVTDGVSEPFCLEALPVGEYRISRSIASNEQPTTTTDQTITLAAGDRLQIAFGSVNAQPTPAASAEQEVAMVSSEMSSGTAGESGNTAVDETSDSAGISPTNIAVGFMVGIAILLFIGVLFVVLSARRTN
jgi:murein DD-endopeptidase MepM/ murein hydrolase activator NlpD